MKLDSKTTAEQVKRDTLKLLNSHDESLVASINDEYLAADFFMPSLDAEKSIDRIRYYGWDMAYARMEDGRTGYTFISSRIAGSIATTPGMACGRDRCALYFDDFDHNSTNFMCGYYSVVEFVSKQ